MKSNSLKTSLLITLDTIRRNKGDLPALKKISTKAFNKGIFYLKQEAKYNLYKVRYADKFEQLKESIYVIYNMGKVGSTTLYSTLWEKIPHENLFHVHFLSEDGIKKREDFHKDENITANDKEIVNYLKRNQQKKFKIITLVREPVSRDISDLFECLHIYFPGRIISQITDEELKAKLEANNFEHTLHWFDEEFGKYLQYDIYQTPFDKEKGYKIYKNGNTEILLIRVEDLSECYQEALYEFTGIHFPELINTNITDDKESAELNKRFKKNFSIDKEKLEKLYASKYVRHFYTNEEIASFLKKYSA